MNLGKTVVGGIVGALVGVAAQVGMEQVLGYPASWFPIVIGLLTAFGVRKMDPSIKSTVSYLRGGVAALIALGAIFVAVQVGSSLTVKNLSAANADSEAPRFQGEATRQLEGDEGEDEAAEAEPAEVEPEATPEPAPTQTLPGLGQKQPLASNNFDMVAFICMALGTFLAYEFSRGSSPIEARVDPDGNEPPEPATPPVPPSDSDEHNN